MNGKLVFTTIVLSLLLVSAPAFVNAQDGNKPKPIRIDVSPPTVKPKPQPTTEPQKTGQTKIALPTKFEDEILAEINFVRTKPAEYASMLKDMRKYYNGLVFSPPGGNAFRSNEGAAALDEAVGVLEKMKPLSPLQIRCADVRASRDHLGDLQRSGSFSHFGSDGSSPEERLERYLNGGFLSAENLVGRNGNVREIVMMLVLDDGLAARIHRKNLLNPSFKFAGISNGNNIKKLNLTVVVLSDSTSEKENCEIKN